MTAGPGTPPAGAAPGAAAATLGVRVGARLLDVLIVAIPAALLLTLAGLGTSMVGFGLRGWIGSAVYGVLWFGYFTVLESSRGATLGKQLLNLRVVTADGATPSIEQTAKRNAWMLLGIVPFLGGLAQLVAVIAIIVTIANDPHARGWHDRFADTGVVR